MGVSMRLKKLTEEDMKNAASQKIYCYEKSLPHLSELCDTYKTENRICRIIDDSTRRQKTFCLKGKEIPMLDSGELEQEDFSDSLVIITSDYHREAYEKLRRIPSLCRALDTIYYFADRETETEIGYRRKYEQTPLEELILFRSGPHAASYVKGMDYADNARALFEYMLREGYNQRYRLVWLVKEAEEFSGIAGRHENVSFVSYDWSVSEEQEERDAYYRALCLAKYIFMTDAYGFARNARKDQIRVQLWHGCGFKTRVNFVRCEKRYEYTTVISDLYAKIHQEIYGLRADQVLVTGYAKEDWLFHPAADALERLHIPKASHYIFWLPTFRMAQSKLAGLNEYETGGQTGLPLVDSYEKLKELDEMLDGLDTILLIKLHPFQDRDRIGQIQTGHIRCLDQDLLVETDIQINQLLGYADGLISDYSSAAVDYMLLDRPIGFTLDDVEEYKKSRGFVFDDIREWLPGAELFFFEQFCAFIKDIVAGHDPDREKRKRLLGVMHRYRDDRSCQRIMEALRIKR